MSKTPHLRSHLWPHLWQGEWITDEELSARVGDWDKSVSLDKRFDLRVLFETCDRVGHRLLNPDDELRLELESCLREGARLDAAEIAQTLAGVGDFLKRRNLERKLERELGTTEALTPRRVDYAQRVFESWAPLGTLVHIAPTNAVSVGVLSVIEGLLSGNLNFLKTGGSESHFAQVVLKAIIDQDLTGCLKQFIIVARIPSSEKTLLESVLSHADGVAVWGGETAVEAVRQLTPAHARFIDWGPKISFAVVARGLSGDEPTLKKLAQECCYLEQQACSSPQCIYLETSSRSELEDFALRLGEALNTVSPGVPRLEPAPDEQAEITSVMELVREESCLDLTRVIEASDGSWRVLVEHHPGLRASPLFRTVWVKPISKAELIRTLRPLRSYLQTAGLACENSEVALFSDLLIAAGVTRITAIGEMLGSYMGEPHDGVYALQRYSRRVSVQQPQGMLDGVVSFSELRPSAHQPVRTEILTKEGFQALKPDPAYAELFFKSGGSSGEPKLSCFSYEDYHLQMRAAADGLYAAGLDPTQDRCMNLFFGGGLYGGFVSFFTILEFLRARQFPMAAHSDLTMVAQTIVRHDVNVLLGMPSYLIQLFEENAEIFEAYRGVKKIYYGGEHFNEALKQRFRSQYNVEVIRSASYGSVDAGPIGFQCAHCEGSQHHLYSDLHTLEILTLDGDQPASVGVPGRVIITSLARHALKLERYEIGDVARLIPDACPCGRSSPRFELLGRHGDVFRIGSAFFNYGKFVQILEDHFGYGGEVQVRLHPARGHAAEEIEVLVSQAFDGRDAATVLLDGYKDLHEAVILDRVLGLRVSQVTLQQFVRTPGSGKLRRIIDARGEAST